MSANPEQAQQAPPQPRPHPNLIRPEELQKATFLDDATRVKYTVAFRQFWNFVEQKPPGSPEHQQALSKLTEWSSKLRSLATQHRMRMQQQQAAKAQQQAQQSGSQDQSQTATPPQSQGQNQAQGAQNSQQASQQSQQRPQSQQAQQSQPAGQQQTQGQGQTQEGQMQQQQGAAARPAHQPQIPPQIVQHVQQFQYSLPPNITPGTVEAENKIKEMRNSYAMSLTRQDQAAREIKRLNQLIEQRRKEGQEIGQDLITSRQQHEAAYNSMKSFVEDFRKKQKTFHDMAKNRAAQTQQTQQQQQGQPAQQSQTQAQQQSQAPPGAAQSGPQQAGGAAATGGVQVKVEGGASAAAATTAPTQPGGPAATAGPGLSQTPATTQTPTQLNRPTASPATTQPPGSAGGQFNQAGLGQQQAQQGGQQAQQPQPQGPGQQPNGMQTAVRPPSLPGQAPNSAGAMPPQMQHGSPATQLPPGGPIPLTHHAAVSAAARSHSDRTGTPQQASTFRPTHHDNPNSLNNPKMPIPKNLSVPPPQPVTMPPARPTLGGPGAGAPGMMGQPVINKLPAYMLEGEGDRVLSKKKLDELVRQVTGGGEGNQNESLTPEVEEAMLQLADDFVDNVISSACKLSKLRDSQQLDIRDIQLVLERNYNIRIPGYASDEIRTVRKLHPNSAWNEKMKALQAAKIMGGKSDL